MTETVETEAKTLEPKANGTTPEVEVSTPLWRELDSEIKAAQAFLPKAEKQEAELVQTVFMEPEARPILFDLLKPGHFFQTRRQTLWRVMLNLYKSGRALEPLGVIDGLSQAGIDRFEASIFLGDFIGIYAPLPYYAKDAHTWATWAEAVIIAAAKRYLLNAAKLAQASTVDGENDLDQVIRDLRDNLQKIENIGIRKTSTPWVTLLDDPATQTGQVVGALSTGFESCDRLLRGGGLLRGDLIIVAARTSRGKSTWCKQVAGNVADAYSRGFDRPPVIGLFEFEASKQAAVRRTLGIRAELSYASLQAGAFTAEEDARRKAELRRQVGWSIEVKDTRGMTWADIKRECRAIKQAHGHLDLLIVDYLNLVSAENRKQSRQEQLEQICGDGKTIAGELDVPLIMPAQIGRAALNKSGELVYFTVADIRGSGAIEQDADKVIILQEPREEETGGYEFESTLAKQREGQVGSWRMRFDRAYGGFVEIPNSTVFGLTIAALEAKKGGKKKKHGPLYQEEEF